MFLFEYYEYNRILYNRLELASIYCKVKKYNLKYNDIAVDSVEIILSNCKKSLKNLSKCKCHEFIKALRIGFAKRC